MIIWPPISYSTILSLERKDKPMRLLRMRNLHALPVAALSYALSGCFMPQEPPPGTEKYLHVFTPMEAERKDGNRYTLRVHGRPDTSVARMAEIGMLFAARSAIKEDMPFVYLYSTQVFRLHSCVGSLSCKPEATSFGTVKLDYKLMSQSEKQESPYITDESETLFPAEKLRATMRMRLALPDCIPGRKTISGTPPACR